MNKYSIQIVNKLCKLANKFDKMQKYVIADTITYFAKKYAQNIEDESDIIDFPFEETPEDKLLEQQELSELDKLEALPPFEEQFTPIPASEIDEEYEEDSLIYPQIGIREGLLEIIEDNTIDLRKPSIVNKVKEVIGDDIVVQKFIDALSKARSRGKEKIIHFGPIKVILPIGGSTNIDELSKTVHIGPMMIIKSILQDPIQREILRQNFIKFWKKMIQSHKGKFVARGKYFSGSGDFEHRKLIYDKPMLTTIKEVQKAIQSKYPKPEIIRPERKLSTEKAIEKKQNRLEELKEEYQPIIEEIKKKPQLYRKDPIIPFFDYEALMTLLNNPQLVEEEIEKLKAIYPGYSLDVLSWIAFTELLNRTAKHFYSTSFSEIEKASPEEGRKRHQYIKSLIKRKLGQDYDITNMP